MDEIEKIFNDCYSESKVTINSEGIFEPTDKRMDLQDFRRAIEKLGYIANVMISLDDFPENMPLYKDSGLWQLRSDDMETVVVQQHVNQSDAEFITACKYLSES